MQISGKVSAPGTGLGLGSRPWLGPGLGQGLGSGTGLGSGQGLGQGLDQEQGHGPGLGLGPGLGQGLGPGLGSIQEQGQGLGLGLGSGLETDLDIDLDRVYAFCDLVLTALDVKQVTHLFAALNINPLLAALNNNPLNGLINLFGVKQGPAHIEVMIRLSANSNACSPSGSSDSSSGTSSSNNGSCSSSGSSGSSFNSGDSSVSIGSSGSSGGNSTSGSVGGSIVLIEANCGRWHGQDTVSLCTTAYGHNAAALSIIALLAAMDEEDALRHWQNIPTHPPVPQCAGRIVHLVSHVEGVLTAPPKHLDTVS